MAPPLRPSLFRSETLATALILAFLVFLMGGTAFVLRNAYQSAAAIARIRAISSAEVVAANFEWVGETSQQLLQRVDDFVGPSLDALPANALGFLKESVSTLPGSPRIYLVGADGNTRLTTDPDFKPIDIRDRDYFQAVADGAARYISPMLVSRLNGEQIFVISKRVERNGVFVGAAIVSFNSQLIEKVWSSLRFDPTSTISAVREDGKIVARYPRLESRTDISDSVLFTTFLPQAPNGTYEAVSVADGVKRIVAYRRVGGSNLVAIASIGHDVAFAAFYNFAILSLAVAVPLALFLAALAWITFQWLSRDARQREQLAAALESNQMLFREIHHRVKNNLQAVSSLVNLQKIDPHAKQEMTQRIQAMVAVHEQIYRNDQFGLVDASAYIPAIIGKLVESYGREVKVAYDLAPMEVDREHALPLGLVANEVVSNAMKYAFQDGRDGALTVTLKKSEDGRMGILTIHDNGAGFDPESISKGTGSRLVSGLAAQIQGETGYTFDSGTKFEMRFPLPNASA
ncbi:MAG TPA: histidine kinase dimerization/phosphoacceptor domain -containing protein [Aestuariivirga sp.]|nr:histidine kinase dimerization/phosphoacceptor domain -containing protein [Aestuariivirga sp.]